MAWIIGGAMLGSAALGKKGSKNASKNSAADAQARISQQLFSETDPLRQSLIGRSSDFLGAGTPGIPGIPAMSAGQHGIRVPAIPGQPGIPGRGFTDVMATPTYAAYKDAADRTFQRAKSNALATLPTGGSLSDSLVNLEGQRASNLTQGAGNIYESELARAMTLATGQTGTAVGGLGQAANAQGLSAQAGAAQNAAKSGALGTGAGAYIGNKQGSATTPTPTPSSSGGK